MTSRRSLPAGAALLLLGLLHAACGSSPASTTSSGTTAASSASAGAGGASSTTTSTGGSGSGSGSGGASATTGTGGAAPTALIHFIGRFDTSDPAGPRFAWPGSAIAASFTGTGLSVKLDDAGTNYFMVVIDGGTPTVVATTSATDTYTLATGLSAGQHQVWIEKRTESYVGVVQFLGLTPTGGQLVPTPEPFPRRIEMVGDSITCGYGDEGVGPTCSFTPGTEDEYLAYGALTARALGAEHAGISYSGIGVYRDYSGSTTNQMPVRYELTLADDPTSAWGFSWTPDVVVVNLGTNDFATGDPGQAYVDALTAFAKQVRGHYASAHLLLAVGSMLSGTSRTQAMAYAQSVITARQGAGDSDVSFVDLGVQDQAADGIGCDYHPSLATHQLMAMKLTAAIKQVTGW